LDNQVKKIEDLSSGVHYLHLLHQVHPDVVKMAKVNLKASQEYENINNLRLLASYLAQVKTPFTFEVTCSIYTGSKSFPKKLSRKLKSSQKPLQTLLSSPKKR
jgi:hypothetical protein